MKYNFTKEDYEQAAKVSLSIAGICRYLHITPRGGNYATIKRKLKEYNIDTSHFTGKGWNVGMKFNPTRHFKLEEILRKDFPYNTQKLKDRLIKSGIKEHKCEKCGNYEWNGEKIPIELHHINGDRNDNRIENLQILCPNCHAQTDHYRGKNVGKIKRVTSNFKSDIELKEDYDMRKLELAEEKAKHKKRYVQKEKRYCAVCGTELKRKQNKYCSYACMHEASKKFDITSDDLISSFKVLRSYCAVAKKYNVSDNAIKKRCIQLGIIGIIDEYITHRNHKH